MNTLTTFFETLNDLHTKSMELAAIWLEHPVQTSEGRTVRIAPGVLINVVDGKIQGQGELTHKVIGCYGTLYNQFEISVMEISNNQISIIKL